MATSKQETIESFAEIPSLGPVLAERLYETMDIQSPRELYTASQENRLTSVNGIGRSSQESIRDYLQDELDEIEDEEPISETPNLNGFSSSLLNKIVCPNCNQSEFMAVKNNLKCKKCGKTFEVSLEVLDFLAGRTTNRGIVQNIMENQWYVKWYERVLRPSLTRIVSSRSMSEEYALSTRMLDLQKRSQVLDVACGTGNFTRRFAKHLRAIDEESGRSIVAGFDLSWPMLKIARRKINNSGLRQAIDLLRGDAMDLPFRDNTFSHLHCSGSLHLMESIPQALNQFAQVLEPGGTMVLGTFLIGDGLIRPLAKRFGELLTRFHWFTRDELYEKLNRTGFRVQTESIAGEAITVKAERIG